MPSYKVLVFSTNQLVRWEEIEAPDDLAAINAVPACAETGKIEVWRGDPSINPSQRTNCSAKVSASTSEPSDECRELTTGQSCTGTRTHKLRPFFARTYR